VTTAHVVKQLALVFAADWALTDSGREEERRSSKEELELTRA